MDMTNKIFIRIGDGQSTEISHDDFYIMVENYVDTKKNIMFCDSLLDEFLSKHDIFVFGDEKLIDETVESIVESHNESIRDEIEFYREQRYQDSIIPSRKSDDMTDYEYYRMVGYEPTR